jgi:hypothetical protein
MRNPESTWPEDVEKQIQTALSKYDYLFEKFATGLGAKLIRDYHNQISRHITLLGPTDEITRSIQITAGLKMPTAPADVNNWIFAISGFAWKDNPDKRNYWSEKVALLENLNQSEREIQGLLDECWEKLLRIKEGDLFKSIKRK